MHCPNCQHDNPPQAKFCSECGARLVQRCAGCGAELPAGARFCPQCGQPAGVQTGFESPETYIPKYLAEKILTSRASIEGERKQVTVLFADLKGSMELLADRDPEEARRILDPVLGRMMEAVHRYEGTVNQVMGDGIMALFGAPLAHEDHAARACFAALRMQQTVRELAQALQRTEGVPIQIRVGLNSGEVVVRSIGSDLRMDYTAVGQTTHLAARMEQMAMPGSVLVSAGTLKLAEGCVDVRPLGPIRPKGLAEAVEVYELTGGAAIRRRFDAARVRGLTPFVGRQAELEQLRNALARAAQGDGQVVAIVGEPGVGKSRLFHEFLRSHRTRGWLVLESCSVSYGKATPYLPVLDLLRTYFQIESREDPRRVREKVTGKLLALDRALEPGLPALLALLDAPAEEARWRELDPAQRRQQTVEAVRRLLVRESQVQPLCLVFEDLHWIDSETQAMLDRLVESLPRSCMLLLVNYRPEYRHGWSAKTYYTQLRVDALPAESAEELLAALLGDDPGLGALRRLLIERTGGNPFFLEESVRTLAETHALAGERGAYRLARPVEAIQVPATVQALLAARIDRLASEEKHLLQVASVIGETVPRALLAAVADLPPDALEYSLDRLQALEFLYQTGLFPDIEYTFRHGLTYQVAYESLLQERRRSLHARIVEALETLHAGRLAEQVAPLANHAFRGALWDKALRYLRQAAEKALDRSANREALALLEHALEAAAKLPQTHETLSELLDVQLKRGPALIMGKGGHAPEVEQCYAAAQALCERLGDESRLFPAVWGRWASAFFSGRCGAASGLAERLLEMGRKSGDSVRLLEGHHCLWATHLATGTLSAGLEHADQGIRLYDPRQHYPAGLLYAGHDPGVCARTIAAWMLWGLGTSERALARAGEAERLARELSHPNTLANAMTFAAYLYWFCGETDAALEKVRAVEELGRTYGLAAYLPIATVLAGRIAVHRGRRADGLAAALGALPALHGWRHTIAVSLVAESCAETGEFAKGLEVLAEGLATAERDGMGIHLSELHRLRGELLARASSTPTPDAIASLRRALELAQRQQARSLELRAATSLARLLAPQGRRDEARETLSQVYRAFTEGLDTRDLVAAREVLDALR